MMLTFLLVTLSHSTHKQRRLRRDNLQIPIKIANEYLLFIININ